MPVYRFGVTPVLKKTASKRGSHRRECIDTRSNEITEIQFYVMIIFFSWDMPDWQFRVKVDLGQTKLSVSNF